MIPSFLLLVIVDLCFLFHLTFIILLFLTVNLKQCLETSDLISSSDPDFIVVEDGSVYTTNAVSLSSEEKAFAILLENQQEQKQKKIHINLRSHSIKVKDIHLYSNCCIFNMKVGLGYFLE